MCFIISGALVVIWHFASKNPAFNTLRLAEFFKFNYECTTTTVLKSSTTSAKVTTTKIIGTIAPPAPVPVPIPQPLQPIAGNLKLITTNTDPQYKMFVLNQNSELLSGIYLRQGSFEGSLQRILRKSLEKTKNGEVTFFDIGANLGIHALYMAALNYSVVAVEADMETFSIFSQSVIVNRFYNKVQAINAAISSSRGNIPMLRNANNIGNNRIVSKAEAAAQPGLQHTVRGIKLNDLVPFLPHDDIVLKIDIEGHECHVMNAEEAQLLFSSKNITCVAMEFTPKNMNANEACVANMVAFFAQNNYVPYYSSGGELGRKITSTNMYHEINHDVLWLPSSANAADYF
uniref:Methyltransferase FkbM domain-containing protein n=1 Tax=Plectus sambesii TaxID=2011161 RepID=A0A914VQK2_9BILA